MADAVWKKFKDNKTAKRGKKRDAGDTTHKLLKGNELTVQRLSSEISGKVCQNWAEGICAFHQR